MNTIIDYLEKEAFETFDERPISPVDSLILSQFSYLKFDGMVPNEFSENKAVSLVDIYQSKDFNNLFSDERYREDNTRLFKAMLGSRRFCGVRLSYYVNQYDTEDACQFSAITINLGNGEYYVAFRGTDETIVGWREDFNLAFSKPVKGQLMSVKYLDKAASGIKKPFYVGGHSKGGNFATYSAMNAKSATKDKILTVFDHDGPGFRPEVSKQCGLDDIESKIVKTVPQSSLVGMLLCFDGHYEVVESKTVGILQHNPFSWEVKNGEFVYVERLRDGAKVKNKVINEWIMSLEEDEMRVFVNTLCGVLDGTKYDNLIDMMANWKDSLKSVTQAAKELDPKTYETITEILTQLFDMLSKEAKDELQQRAIEERDKFLESIGKFFKKTDSKKERRDAKKGLATLCVGGGMGCAAIVEKYEVR